MANRRVDPGTSSKPRNGEFADKPGKYTPIIRFHKQVIDPGEELEMEWQVKPFSVRFFPDDREPDTTFVEPGEYTFIVMPDVFEVNGEEATLPEIENTFVIE